MIAAIPRSFACHYPLHCPVSGDLGCLRQRPAAAKAYPPVEGVGLMMLRTPGNPVNLIRPLYTERRFVLAYFHNDLAEPAQPRLHVETPVPDLLDLDRRDWKRGLDHQQITGHGKL